MNTKRFMGALLFAVFFCELSLAQTKTNESVEKDGAEAPRRPKIALVLSGGGARGFAHIGVLKKLRAMRIPIDMVVGTSIGAVVGGAYAAGRTPQELEQIISSTNWNRVLADRPARDDIDILRKEEDLLIPTRIEFAYTKASGFTLPPATAGNASLDEALTRLLPEGLRDQALDQLALPFKTVASDLLTGEAVELSDTPLLPSMRASIALPGVFSPSRIRNKLVVDGGLVNNLPVDMARAMGADIVIAVNVGTPLAKESELTSALNVATQMVNILTEQNVKRSIGLLGPNDILISPNLQGISFLDFDKHKTILEAGTKAAEKLQNQLSKLTVSEGDYLVFENRLLIGKWIATTPSRALPIKHIEVTGARYINKDILLDQVGLEPGQVKTQQEIRVAAARLYGRGDLDLVETDIIDSQDDRNVIIKTRESISSRNRFRIGLELNGNLNSENNFNFGLMHVAPSINNLGGELRTVIKLGDRAQFATQLFQPISTASHWFVRPSIGYNGNSIDTFTEGRKTQKFGIRNWEASLDFGRLISNWGLVALGVSRNFTKVETILPEVQGFKPLRVYDSALHLQFKRDTLDSLAFPSNGELLLASWSQSRINDPSTQRPTQAKLQMLKATSFGNWVGHGYLEFQNSENNGDSNALGGFLRLSGLPENSIVGSNTVFGRLVFARKIGSLPGTFGGAVGLGFSAELGATYDDARNLNFSNFKQAGSVHLTVDTRLGPVYLGWGATRRQGNSFYLFLGPIW